MTSSALLITHILSALVVVADLLILAGIVVLILFYSKKAASFVDSVLTFFSTWGIWISFVSVVGAFVGSLYYSEIAGLLPCNLCMVQRILMYPQIAFLGAALWKKTYAGVAVPVSLVFSVIGVLVSALHYYGQMFSASLLPCPAGAVSCTRREFVEYGYITIPMMSLTAFLIIVLSLWLYRLGKKKSG